MAAIGSPTYPSTPEPVIHESLRFSSYFDDESLSLAGEGGTVVGVEEEGQRASRVVAITGCESPGCSDLSCKARVFQVPVEGDNKSVLESWSITYHAPITKVIGWKQYLGVLWWRHTEIEDARILSVVPNSHFTQEELVRACGIDRAQYTAQGKSESGHAVDLERRLRKLDWTLQDEIYDLINDRIQSSSNAFRRREWKLVMLTEVLGGEMTDVYMGGSGQQQQQRRGRWGTGRKLIGRFGISEKRKLPKMPISEYRMILRGTETKANDAGWAYHNRYSRPWRNVDEKEIGEIRGRKDSPLTACSDKCVNF
ncbi:hypothetical protein B0H66DRAFT_569608 [Apodospora peruviana]|uniref:Uncharacterized protein n=1 Tax=Apodospora peruviana TaxID=516989 RepID=A0AAE0HUF9_9PEZI|nr:hypothetical protein B0H66DRAFT_569608 [Apodospora peruviana]